MSNQIDLNLFIRITFIVSSSCFKQNLYAGSDTVKIVLPGSACSEAQDNNGNTVSKDNDGNKEK